MAVDSKIETFAKNLFRYLYYESEALPKSKSYEDSTPEDSFMRYEVLKAVMCRQEIFHWLYTGVFNQKYDAWKHSTMDFYVYLLEEFSDFTPYLKPNVFDKILISCAFVLEMGLRCAYKNNSLYLDFPTCWAMFFDSELKEEFYSKGGWEALEKYSLKYQAIHQYISEILAKRCVNDSTFVENLIQKANTDYNLQYIAHLLEERTSRRAKSVLKERKYIGNVSMCYECLPIFSMSFEKELFSETQTIPAVERVLQVLLHLIPPPELKEYERKAVERFWLRYSQEKDICKLTKLVSHIRGAQRKLASQEVCTRIFAGRKLPDECTKYDSRSCACCLQKLESLEKKELSLHVKTIKAVIDEVTFSERTKQRFPNIEISDLCQKKNKTQTSSATASLNPSQDSNLIEEDLALKLFLALGIKTSISHILTKAQAAVEFKHTDESHQFECIKNCATNQTVAKKTNIQKKKVSGRSM